MADTIKLNLTFDECEVLSFIGATIEIPPNLEDAHTSFSSKLVEALLSAAASHAKEVSLTLGKPDLIAVEHLCYLAPTLVLDSDHEIATIQTALDVVEKVRTALRTQTPTQAAA